MSATLSQHLQGLVRSPAPRARLGPALSWISWLGTLALLVVSGAGCDSRESSRDGEGDEAAAPFVWPDDPDAPRLSIEIGGEGSVSGTIEIELIPELAPKTVAHVLALAGDGFYDGTTFHRVIPGFMIQGGDPNTRDRNPENDGQGGMGTTVEDEFSEAPFVRGVVAMANQGRQDSNGSQIFIMHGEDRGLDGRYSVIGRVRSGMEVVDAIAEVETDAVGRWGPRNRPIENVVMAQVRPEAAADFLAATEASTKP